LPLTNAARADDAGPPDVVPGRRMLFMPDARGRHRSGMVPKAWIDGVNASLQQPGHAEVVDELDGPDEIPTRGRRW
jgi:hypothetical protein